MPVVLVALIVLFVMLIVLCLPPVLCIQMIQSRRALAPPEHRLGYLLGLAAAGAALAFNFYVCLAARPEVTFGGLDWETIGYIHLTALLLSWLALWAAVALAVLVRKRRVPGKPKRRPEQGNGEMA
jgi:hypothetical protein